MRPQIEFSRRWLKDALESEKHFPTSKELELKHILEAQEKLNRLAGENNHMQKELDAIKGVKVQRAFEPAAIKIGIRIKRWIKDTIKRCLRFAKRVVKRVLKRY